MLDEPLSKHHAVEDIHLFIVDNYLTVAHVAALRLLLRRRVEGLPKAEVDALLDQTCALARNTLSGVQKSLRAAIRESEPAVAEEFTGGPTASEPGAAAAVSTQAEAWSGWLLLHRRLSLLQADIGKIAMRGMLIGRLLSRAE